MRISISDGLDYVETIDVANAEEIAKQALKSDISTSVFKENKRNLVNFISADCIGLDIDNDGKKGTALLSIEDAKRVFSPLKHIILTTKSHGIEKNGKIADRFRVILFFTEPILNTLDFYSTWHWLKSKFPAIDNQCKDPSRYWSRHTALVSLQEMGMLINPVKYTEPEEPSLESRKALPGERGELSKETLQFLEFGVEEGSRNGTVYKVAREFQQALYDYSETKERIFASLKRNNVFTRDFTESEVEITVRSAFSKDAKYAARLPDLKPRAFAYTRVGDLLDRSDQHEDWLVQDLLLRGGISLVAGIPKIGKTTLIRQLERCILRGEPFLERKTQKGDVIHYSFDEKARTAKRHYATLGLNNQDQMILHFGEPGNSDYKKEFAEDITKYKPSLVVVDTLFDMVDAQDVNSYGPIKRSLAFFSTLSEKTNTHIMFIHHQNKPNKEYGQGSGHTVLGSTAITGSMDCNLIFEQVGDSTYRTVSASGRAIEGFSRKRLIFDSKKMMYFLEKPKDNIDF